MKKKLLLFFGVTIYYVLIVYLVNVFFRGGGHAVIFPVFMISAFFFSMFLSKKEILISFSLLWGITILQSFNQGVKLNNIIIYVIFIPLTFWLGYYLKNKNIFSKVFYVAFLIFIGIYGFPNLWATIYNANARQHNKAPIMLFETEAKNKIRLDTIKNKVIVLDYWTTSCGNCFKGFPDYEKLFLEYQNNLNVEMYAVNIPLKRDTINQARSKISKYNYQFPVLYAASDENPKSLGFNGVPHLIILKDGIVRFNGSIILDKKVVNNLKAEIEILLKE